jgi:hypothetical protein
VIDFPRGRHRSRAEADPWRTKANMRSAREAVAWTYGLPEQLYHPVVRT